MNVIERMLDKFLKPKLGTKFTVFFIMTQIVIWAILCFTVVFFMRASLVRMERSQLENSASLIAAAVLPYVFNNEFLDIQAQLDKVIENDRTREIVFVGVYDREGRALATRARSEELHLTSGKEREILKGDRLLKVSQPILYEDMHFGRVDIYSAQTQIGANIRKVTSTVIILFLLFIAALIPWIMFAVFRMVSRPLARLSQSAGIIAKGDLDARINIESHDELGELAAAFNSMARNLAVLRKKELAVAYGKLERSYQRLQDAYDEMKKIDEARSEFIAVGSHELRTPLHTLKVNLEALSDGRFGSLPRKQLEVAEAMGRSIDRLAKKVNDLLNYAQVERGELKIDVDVLDMRRILTHILEEYAPVVKHKGLKLLADIPEELPFVCGDTFRLHEVFENILGNALKFTYRGGRISVLAREKDNMVEIVFSDTGIGISQKEISKIFTAYYQVDRSATREFDGLGLGLTISKAIVEAHGGRIEVFSEKGKGSTFTCVLPVEPSLPRIRGRRARPVPGVVSSGYERSL